VKLENNLGGRSFLKTKYHSLKPKLNHHLLCLHQPSTNIPRGHPLYKQKLDYLDDAHITIVTSISLEVDIFVFFINNT
jgi:hypothetical protein